MRTVLYAQHLSLEAKIVPFANWEMPLHYSKGIIHEHHVVRKGAGLFDVSHMGRIAVNGPDAEKFLDHLATNRIVGKPNFSTTYTVFANHQGGSIDDLIVYKKDLLNLFVVANASNCEKDLAHLRQEATHFQVHVEENFRREGILALQGPQALAIAIQLFPELQQLQSHRFLELTYLEKPLIVARTGYTGEPGVEFFVPHDSLIPLWESLLTAGAEPVGLGARDTLRLEMGYALYGHELSETIAPTESVAAWTVKWEKPDFLGKAALEALENSSSKRHAYGVRLVDKGIAREGYEVCQDGKRIGTVTSGSFSPSLNRAIALILVNNPLKIGEMVTIPIREHPINAIIVPLPFYRAL